MAEVNGTSTNLDNAGKPATPNPAAADPAASTADDTGASRRPRDSRIIHLMLASMGVHGYHERVPLMVMDLAYRYTSAVLQDALLTADIINPHAGGAGGGGATSNANTNLTVDDLRVAIASRVNSQFNTSLPKEYLLEIALERNRVALPVAEKGYGIRMPPEKYCLTGVNWELDDVDDFDYDDDGADDDDAGENEGPDRMEGVVAAGGVGAGANAGAEEREEDDEIADLFGNDGVKDESMVDV